MEIQSDSVAVRKDMSMSVDYKKNLLQWNLKNTHRVHQSYRQLKPSKPTLFDVLRELNISKKSLNPEELHIICKSIILS